MNKQSNRRTSLLVGTLAALSLAALPSHAATLYWDGTDIGADADGGTGTWDDLTTSNWDDAATAGVATTWNNANNDIAVFGGAADTVTIDTGGVTAGGVTFDTANYIIDGDTLTLASTGDIANGGQATINSVVAGSTSLNKTGSGTLQLTNLANTFSGNISVGGGKVLFKSLSNDSATRTLQGGNFTGDIDIAAGGRFEFWSYGGNGTPQEFSGDISGDGDVWLAYNCTFILSGTNTSTGTTTVQGELNGRTARLEIASFDSVSPSVVLGRGGMQANGILDYTGIGETTDTAIKLVASGNSTKIVNNLGTGTLTFTTPWTSVAGTGLRAPITTDADMILQGFSLPGTPGYLQKRGDARLSLSGPCEVWDYVQFYGGTLEIDSEINDGGIYRNSAIATGPGNGGTNFITVPAGTPVEVGMSVVHGRITPGTTIVAITDIGADPVVCEISTNASGPNKTESGSIGFAGALGIGLPTVDKLRWVNSATLKYTGPSDTSNRGFTIDNGDTATWEITNSATNLEVSGDTASTSGNLVKTGDGTLTFSGAHNYTGATTVTVGTLGLNGSTHTSPITVATGASVEFTLGATTTSTANLDLSSGTVKISGTPTLASYTLFSTTGTITGPPVLDAAIAGYELVLAAGDTELQLNSTGGGNNFSDWIGGFTLTDTTLQGDDDGDDQSNAVENYFGTDPSAFSAGITAGAVTSGGTVLTFTHPINEAPGLADDLTAAYQWSTDLQTFNADGGTEAGTTVTFSAPSITAGVATVTATISGTALDELFINVLVSQP